MAECVESFEYPMLPETDTEPLWDLEPESIPAEAMETLRSSSDPANDGNDCLDEQVAEELRRSFEAGRERGQSEGRQFEHEAQAAVLATAEERHRLRAVELVDQFARERDRYLQAVEQEVVHLALAVAARILRREAQMDPLLLTGAVRVALGQLSETTQVRLRVPAAEVELWQATITILPNLPLKPVVEADADMHSGECLLETKLGSVDLGIRAQLAEIERGFFDRTGRSTVASENSDVVNPDLGANR